MRSWGTSLIQKWSLEVLPSHSCGVCLWPGTRKTSTSAQIRS